MTGLMVIPFIGWTGGTLVGAFASQLLPEIISNVMGIMLYGMFIAIFIPAAKKSRPILTAVLIAVAFSIIFRYFLTFISSGFAIILSAVISAVICAALFPVKEEDTV
jgi:predicted branched-subunit amino acid permease